MTFAPDPAFYVDDRIGYVSVSGGCYMRRGGGGASTAFPDGRTFTASLVSYLCAVGREVERWVARCHLTMIS